MVDDYKALAAEHWFGFGRWSAPYWFVGMEQGGEQDALVYKAWHELGAQELVDLKAHSKACDDMKYLVEYPPLGRTWTKLIRFVLGYEAAPSDNEAVRKYQRDQLGRSDGETALIELSGINAPNMRVPVAEREHHRTQRIATIRQRLIDSKPKFVVFYGFDYREEYERVAGGKFDSNDMRWIGSTPCILLRHPTAWVKKGSVPECWIERGQQMHTINGPQRIDSL